MKTLRLSLFGKTVSTLLLFAVLLLSSCSKDAEDSANSTAQAAGAINGVWQTTGGLLIKISGVTPQTMGRGILNNVGTSFPAAAVGGECLSEIEYIRGGYWEAFSNTYSTGGSWSRNKVVGLAMNDGGTEFKIGTAVYVKQ
jgi:hypothetical protein